MLQNDVTRGRIYTLSDSSSLTVRRYLRAIRTLQGVKTRIIYVPYVIAWMGVQALNAIKGITGKGPHIAQCQLRYLFCDALASGEALTLDTGWQPMKRIENGKENVLGPTTEQEN